MAEATPETTEAPKKEAADIVQEPVPSPLEPATEFEVLNSHLEEASERLARSTHLSPQSLRDWLVNDLCPIFGDVMKAAEWYVLDLAMRSTALEENAEQESEDSLTPEFGAQIIEFIGRSVQLFGAIAPMLQAQNPQLLEELQLLVAVAPGLLSNVQDAIVLEEDEEEDEEYEDEEGDEEDDEEGDEEGEDEEEGAEEQPVEPSVPAPEPVVDTSETAEPVVDTSETAEPITDTSGEEKSDGAETPAEEPAAEEVPDAVEPTAVEQMQEAAHVDPEPEPIETPAETPAEAPAEPVTETETPAEEPEAKPEEGSDG